MPPTKNLIDRCIKQESNAQRELYDLYAPSMMVVAMRYSKSDQEAEDVLQEAFIKVFDKIDSYRRESDLRFWIKRIVVNTALNQQRSKLYMFPMVDIKDVDDDLKNDISLSSFHFQELLKLIQELPTGSQTVFNLYAIEGYSHKEIGELLNVSEGTSKSQYARAKKLLREKITKENLSYERAK